MSKFIVEIETGNSAFGENPEIEVARLLLQTAHRVEANGEKSGKLKDGNGTTVGRFKFHE